MIADWLRLCCRKTQAWHPLWVNGCQKPMMSQCVVYHRGWAVHLADEQRIKDVLHCPPTTLAHFPLLCRWYTTLHNHQIHHNYKSLLTHKLHQWSKSIIVARLPQSKQYLFTNNLPLVWHHYCYPFFSDLKSCSHHHDPTSSFEHDINQIKIAFFHLKHISFLCSSPSF